ncbi:DUF6734 family protein [Spongiimicrobium salis]|uniref:DUF6734 family protein n=1 Tax=Spongiimicrobium salis TaxID=1667022 RepID=UPI00374D0CF3
MKIVQSYWSKPSSDESGLNPNNRNLGGWLEKKHNYMSWTLSCLQLRKFYNEVELVTDEAGYNLLIEQLKLPYTQVKVKLDDLNGYHNNLWALGKIYTYGLQKEPFIHVDGDVFIWNRLPAAIEKATLCAQNYEVDEPGYEHVYNHVKRYFNYFPDFMNYSEGTQITSVNAGIMGGNNINFFEEYATVVFDFIHKNSDKMAGLDTGSFNMFYEQYLFLRLAEQKTLNITFLVNDQRELLDQYVNLTGAPIKTDYIHTVGAFKKRIETGKLLDYTLKKTHPDYYYRLIKSLKQHLI